MAYLRGEAKKSHLRFEHHIQVNSEKLLTRSLNICKKYLLKK